MSGVLAVIVGVLTLTPAQSLPQAPGTDKLHHFLAFGAIAAPLAFARPKAAVWIALLVMAYGGLIEVIQPYVGRTASWGDMAANALGAAGAAYVASWLGRHLRV